MAKLYVRRNLLLRPQSRSPDLESRPSKSGSSSTALRSRLSAMSLPRESPRSSGVVYKTVAKGLYIAVAPDSWKARHLASGAHVSVTVPVHRGGILALALPIPPATISFQATANVHPAGSLYRAA
jgi:hypothetical protein